MEINGTHYDDRTPEAAARVLESARLSNRGTRVRVFLGDTATGKDWGEENDVTGYVGRSTGSVKIPLLIHSSRSLGGPGILDHCIVRIDVKEKGRKPRTAYRHPLYRPARYVASGVGNVYRDDNGDGGTLYARCKDASSAARLAAFMNGERFGK